MHASHESRLRLLLNQLIAKRVAAVNDVKPGVVAVGGFLGLTHFRKTLCILRIENSESAFQQIKITQVLDGKR